jgi:hypothetical protein
MRACRICGVDFRGRSARHWFCGPECKAIAQYEKKSVISHDQYRLLFARQHGMCAICETTEPGGPSSHHRFFADHDHKTGEPRGLLCFRCNTALGNFRDDPRLLLRAAAYVAGGVAPVNALDVAPRSPGTVTSICRYCGKGFHAKPSAIASGGGKYCSKDCYHLGRWGRPNPRKGMANPERWPPRETTCTGCGVSFQFRGKRDRVYCDRSCAARHRRSLSLDGTFAREV